MDGSETAAVSPDPRDDGRRLPITPSPLLLHLCISPLLHLDPHSGRSSFAPPCRTKYNVVLPPWASAVITAPGVSLPTYLATMPLTRHFTMPVSRPQPQPRTASRLSTALAALRQQEEQESLLGGDDEEERFGPQERADAEGQEEIFAADPHKDLPVYRTIHRYAPRHLCSGRELTAAVQHPPIDPRQHRCVPSPSTQCPADFDKMIPTPRPPCVIRA